MKPNFITKQLSQKKALFSVFKFKKKTFWMQSRWSVSYGMVRHKYKIIIAKSGLFLHNYRNRTYASKLIVIFIL